MAQKTSIQPLNDLPKTGFIRLAQLIPHIIPIGRSSVWEQVKRGEFPAPVKLGPATTAWRVEDIRAWMDARATAPGHRRTVAGGV